MLDNEAQLAYVLGHELAHVYKDHWKTKVMMGLAEEEYNLQQARKVAGWTALLGVAGAAARRYRYCGRRSLGDCARGWPSTNKCNIPTCSSQRTAR